MKIKYISNLPLSEKSGGGSAINYFVFHELAKYFQLTYLGPFSPPIQFSNRLQQVASKLLRTKVNYYFFSENRLKKIASMVMERLENENYDALFFHGFTSWLHIAPQGKPYFTYSDASFRSYVEIYNDVKKFNTRDLERIYAAEKQWLKNATRVFFRSHWALEETKAQYNLDGSNFLCVGLAGGISPPEKDSYVSGFNFLFIARRFYPKGGEQVLNAFRKLKKKYEKVTLTIVGEPPPSELLKDQKGIICTGFLRKTVASENSRLLEIFSHAFALVHPTRKDTNTLVVTELAYFGCPSIVTNRYGIPEYVVHEVTGYLLDDPGSVSEIEMYMSRLISNPKAYLEMRLKTRALALENTWERVGNKISSEILTSVTKVSAVPS